MDTWDCFRLKNVANGKTEDFYQFQWTASRNAILTYRILTFLYWLVMFIVSLVRFGHFGFFFVYLSHIGQLLILLFYLMAIITALGGLNVKSKKATSKAQTNGHGTETKRPMRGKDWITLVLFTMAFDCALMVTAVYPMEENFEGFDFISFNKHIINTVLMMLELSLNRFPANLWHFPFATVMAAAYGVVLASLHFTGVNSALYKSFDFARTPIRAWLLSGASIFMAPQIAQCVMCLCNVAKKLVWKKLPGGKTRQMEAQIQLKEIRTDLELSLPLSDTCKIK